MILEEVLSKLIDYALKAGASYADARARRVEGTRVEVVDGGLREVRCGLEEGFNVRVLVEGTWGFASSSFVTPEESLRLVKKAISAAKALAGRVKQRAEVYPQSTLRSKARVKVKVPLNSVDLEEKVELAFKLNEESLSLDEKVKSATTVYSDAVEARAVYTSHGRYVEVETSYLYLSSLAYAFEAGLRQRGFKVHGGVGGFELTRSTEALELGVEAASMALRLLKAPPPPSGRFTCVLDPEIAGTFIHEAFGHACEADLVLSNSSILEGKLGTRVGGEEVTVVDDPMLEGLYGWYPFDDEASEGRRTVIVEEGILKSFLHSLETAISLRAKPTGNARAQGYSSRPIVRMTNTFIAPGTWKPEELLGETKTGLYVKGSNYGYVDTAKGLFSFKCKEAYLLENGEPSKLLRDVALSGLTLEVLINVDGVANDLKFNPGICGKEGQYVPVTDGSPHIRVKGVLVGGVS